MKEKIKKLKLDVTASALITAAMGVVFIVWPASTMTVLVKLFAAAIVLVGIIVLVSGLTLTPVNIVTTAIGGIIGLIGVWFFLSPTVLTNFIPIIVGIWLIIHGVRDLMMTMEGRRYNATRWGIMAAIAVVSILLGIYCIGNAFGIAKATTVIIGIMLVWDGLSDMFIVHKVNKAAKIIDAVVVDETDLGIVDVEATESDVIDETDGI